MPLAILLCVPYKFFRDIIRTTNVVCALVLRIRLRTIPSGEARVAEAGRLRLPTQAVAVAVVRTHSFLRGLARRPKAINCARARFVRLACSVCRRIVLATGPTGEPGVGTVLLRLTRGASVGCVTDTATSVFVTGSVTAAF